MEKKYKLAIIGMGSIGKRHLYNIDLVLKLKGIKYTIDLIRGKHSNILDESINDLVTTIYTDYQDVPDDYDVIFITNPTNLHFGTIQGYLKNTRHMFIEKPVFDRTDLDLNTLSLKKDGIYYVACPLRYTSVIQYVKNHVNLDEVYSARAISSSYLPDWRPDIDYRRTYSAKLEQGGGVSIDLIHEWDYLIYLFGSPNRVCNYRGTFSNLEIDSDDLSLYIAEYNNRIIEVHLDYFGRKTIRELQLFTKADTIIADIANSQIRFLKSNKVIDFKEERNDFQIREIENFFDIVEGKCNNQNTIATALNTLKITRDGRLG